MRRKPQTMRQLLIGMRAEVRKVDKKVDQAFNDLSGQIAGVKEDVEELQRVTNNSRLLQNTVKNAKEYVEATPPILIPLKILIARPTLIVGFLTMLGLQCGGG